MEIPHQIASDPAIRAILRQELPGVYVEKDAEYPVAEAIDEDPDVVTEQLGLALYRSKDGDRSVLFNPLVVQPEEVKTADKEDRLQDIFPEYGQIVPQPGVPEETEAMTPPAPAPIGGMPGGPPPPAPADKLRAMTPQAPPGASNIIGAMQAQPI
jgi:hypothetical protein